MIERRIGNGKRKYRPDRVVTGLFATFKPVIGMALFAINAEKNLRILEILFALLISICVAIIYQFITDP